MPNEMHAFEVEHDDGNDTVGATELIDGYGVPMDPMDLLQCDSCQ